MEIGVAESRSLLAREGLLHLSGELVDKVALLGSAVYRNEI